MTAGNSDRATDYPTGSGQADCMCSMHAPAPALGLVDEQAWLAVVREWDRVLGFAR